MVDSFIAHPRDVFEEEFKGKVDFDRYEYQMGQVVVALEVLTMIKALEDEMIAEAVGEGCAPEVISVLQTLLIELDLFDNAVELYEILNEARKPKIPKPTPLPELSLGGNVIVEQPPAGDLSLSDASPQELKAQRDRIPSWLRGRRSHRASFERAGLPDEEG